MRTKVTILIFIINIGFKPKTKYEERMKNIFTAIVDTEVQKSHPFGWSENRFTWVKKYSNGNDLKNHKKLFNEKKDNIEGGIGHYLNKIKLENEKEMERNVLKNDLNDKKEKKMKYKFQNLNSQRVLYPEKDTEMEKVSKKRTYEKCKNDLLYTTSGRISTLLKKTPLIVKYRGKKILNNSVDYGRKKDTNLFSDAFLNDKTYNRIPGVMRKYSAKKINYQEKPLENLKQGRRHFKIID